VNIDEAIKQLEAQGFEVRKKKRIQVDGSFLGIEMKQERLDSAASETLTPRVDSLEQLRQDAARSRGEMMKALDPNYQSRVENYSGKTTEALRDIARANRDSYCDRLEGYRA
jgi:hypothetical protein